MEGINSGLEVALLQKEIEVLKDTIAQLNETIRVIAKYRSTCPACGNVH